MGVLQYLGSRAGLTPKSQNSKEMVKRGCHLDDKCTPNPCQNGGQCRQNSREFICDCDGTGYEGAVCHTSRLHRSCSDFFSENSSVK